MVTYLTRLFFLFFFFQTENSTPKRLFWNYTTKLKCICKDVIFNHYYKNHLINRTRIKCNLNDIRINHGALFKKRTDPDISPPVLVNEIIRIYAYETK